MCYGDMAYERDGYYEQYARETEQDQPEQEAEDEAFK
jgi:hypothetical protein